MKKKTTTPRGNTDSSKKGYNENNPGQSQGAFTPAGKEKPLGNQEKSNAAAKKSKQDQN